MTPILSSSFCKTAPHSVKLTKQKQKLSDSNHCHFCIYSFFPHTKKDALYIMFDMFFFIYSIFETFLYQLSSKLPHFKNQFH